jgi:FdhD protein
LPSTRPEFTVRHLSATAKADVYKVDVGEGPASIIEEEVAVEAPANIYLNKQHLVTLLSSPTMLCELAVGHLFSEGILKDKETIKEVLVAGTDVHVKLKSAAEVELERIKIGRVVTTACGSLVDYLALLAQIKTKISTQYSVSTRDIERMVTELNSGSRVFKATGGIHSAAIFKGTTMVAFAEDVGRHNAVDKVVGASVLKGVNFGTSVLVTSGRQTADIVAKAAQMGIPFSISISGPIHSGIKLAEKVGITLICFARGRRFNIYTSPERVRLPNGSPIKTKPQSS